MCGRYNLSQQESEEITEIVREVNRLNPQQPLKTGEVFPTDAAPLLLGSEFCAESVTGTIAAQNLGFASNNRFAAVSARWGFVPTNGKGVLINARAETAAEKSLFAAKIKSRRCLVPSTGFFEWTHTAVKQKYLFKLSQEKLLFMAGLFDESGDTRRFVILTTEANASMRGVHSRMPIVLTPTDAARWLNSAQFGADYLKAEQPPLEKLLCEKAEQLSF